MSERIETNLHSFEKQLNALKSESTIGRNDLRTIIETLIKIYKNLVTNKDNERHRRINTRNSGFVDKLWRHSAVKELLLSCGWNLTADEFIVFDDNGIDVSKCLQILVKNRDIKPDSNDWINSDQHFVNPSVVRDQALRQMALKERTEELEAFERNKRETKLMAENVKKEIESDFKHRKQYKRFYNKNEGIVDSLDTQSQTSDVSIGAIDITTGAISDTLPQPQPRVIYVGNFDVSITKDMILALFSPIGALKDCQIVDDSANSDRYCFVEYSEPNCATTAMKTLNKRMCRGRELSVGFVVFVGHLSPEIERQYLREAFSPFGELVDSRVVRDPQTSKSKGYGFVAFVTMKDAFNAISTMNGQDLANSAIHTEWATHGVI